MRRYPFNPLNPGDRERRERFQEAVRLTLDEHAETLRRLGESDKPLTYKVYTDSYVWCDHHCGVHLAHPDYYNEGATECNPNNWRSVFIESSDPEETF